MLKMKGKSKGPYDSEELQRFNQIKMIITKLQSKTESKHRKILITTADKGFNQSLIAYDLAHTFAEKGRKTVLIDANLQQPVLHLLFQESGQLGLTNALHRGEVGRYLIRTKVKNLSFLPLGPSSSRALEGWREDRLDHVMGVLSKTNDVTIIESPSYLTYSETQMLASLCDEIIVVVKHNKDRMRRIRKMKKDLEAAGKEISGIVYQSH
ncbi:CpsD/CapB family tyrosine-protein kinase [Guptibacillus hwajinpoensis]|uniref:CpsD/CapB family tyrosine-protein kinase n=1 Tax=Guptibacillus hwajinpoensis TaxID=208199 RepID=UPI001CFD9CBF|nr:CpsD/CapB family tyrosine-protein kinase [Pseudalkalibacillus hwajinpoensis]WLR61510.1 CpsD/CapB family tyrosine-protein kinase [Pseudalkalibacillus hwajinpoensis]